MYVDIKDLVKEVGEYVVIQPVNEQGTDVYGLQTASPEDSIRTKIIVTEEVIETTSVSGGTYHSEVMYNIYIDSKITKSTELKGAIIVREGNSELVITQKSIDRNYTSHNMYNATERRFGNDSVYR